MENEIFENMRNAIRRDDWEKVEDMLQTFGVSYFYDYDLPVTHGSTDRLLHLFAGKGELDLVKTLIENEWDINQRDELGYTALSSANLFKKTEVINYLLEKGIDVNIRWFAGRTICMEVALARDLEMLNTFCRYGADLSIKDDRGKDVLGYMRDAFAKQWITYVMDHQEEFSVEQIEYLKKYRLKCLFQ